MYATQASGTVGWVGSGMLVGVSTASVGVGIEGTSVEVGTGGTSVAGVGKGVSVSTRAGWIIWVGEVVQAPSRATARIAIPIRIRTIAFIHIPPKIMCID